MLSRFGLHTIKVKRIIKRSKLDPHKLIDKDKWAVTLINTGRSMREDVSGFGHSAIVVEGIEENERSQKLDRVEYFTDFIMSKENSDKGEVRLIPNKEFKDKERSKTWRRESIPIKNTLERIQNIVNEQEKLKKYNFNLVPQEGYSFNCALWANYVLKCLNIKTLDKNSIMNMMDEIRDNGTKKNMLWFYFKYNLAGLSLILHSPSGYVKMNSADKLKELKKRFKDYKKYIE